MQKTSQEEWDQQPTLVLENVIERLKSCVKKMRRANQPGKRLETWMEQDYHYTVDIQTNDKEKKFNFDFIC